MLKTTDICVIIERLNNLIASNTEDHKQILTQTTKTNGTVSEIKEWKAKAQGGFIVINVIVVPVVLWLLFERLKNGT